MRGVRQSNATIQKSLSVFAAALLLLLLLLPSLPLKKVMSDISANTTCRQMAKTA